MNKKAQIKTIPISNIISYFITYHFPPQRGLFLLLPLRSLRSLLIRHSVSSSHHCACPTQEAAFVLVAWWRCPWWPDGGAHGGQEWGGGLAGQRWRGEALYGLYGLHMENCHTGLIKVGGGGFRVFQEMQNMQCVANEPKQVWTQYFDQFATKN